MPPIRTLLRNRDANSRRGKDFTPYKRGKLVGVVEQGARPSAIARQYAIPASTVRTTIRLDLVRPNGISQPRSGKPLCYTPAEERKVLRHTKSHPKDTYAELIEGCSFTCSKNTVKKIFNEHGIKNWMAKCRPYLTLENVAKRLEWALKYRGRNKEEWGMVMWSDECFVEKGKGKKREWYFRIPSQK
jgi:hypothetical protein